jgi:hypothetical protein
MEPHELRSIGSMSTHSELYLDYSAELNSQIVRTLSARPDGSRSGTDLAGPMVSLPAKVAAHRNGRPTSL